MIGELVGGPYCGLRRALLESSPPSFIRLSDPSMTKRTIDEQDMDQRSYDGIVYRLEYARKNENEHVCVYRIHPADHAGI